MWKYSKRQLYGGGGLKRLNLGFSDARFPFKTHFWHKFSPLLKCAPKYIHAKLLFLALFATPITANANVQFWAKGVSVEKGWQPDLPQAGNYCWAHVVASVVGWWQDTSVNLPISTAPRDREQLLELFRKSDPNSQGKHLDLALSWFFQTYYPTLDYNTYHRKINLAGNQDYKAESEAYYNIFSKGYAVGITTYGHAITGWGAEFKDASDPTSIQKIWITDSSYNSLKESIEEYTRNYEFYAGLCEQNPEFCKPTYLMGFNRFEPRPDGMGSDSVGFGTLLLDYLIPYNDTNTPQPEKPKPDPNPEPPAPQPEPTIPAEKLELIGKPITTKDGKLVLFFGVRRPNATTLFQPFELNLKEVFANTPQGSFSQVLSSTQNVNELPKNSDLTTLTSEYAIHFSSNKDGQGVLTLQKRVSEQQKVIFESALAGALSVANNHSSLGQMFNTINAQNLVTAGVETNKVKNFTGSWIKSENLVLNAAFAGVLNENTLLGGFMEAGKGKYETHNDFSNAIVKGDGTSKFIGGGAFVKLISQTTQLNLALRAGQIRTSYQASGFANASLINELDLSRFYYGFLGEVDLNLSQKFQIFTRVSYTNLAKENAKVGTDEFELDAIHSLIGVAGLKLSHEFNKYLKAYASVGAEREFMGEANGKNASENYAVSEYFKTPSMRGNSFVGEVGFGFENINLRKNKTNLNAKSASVKGKNLSNASAKRGFFANFKTQVKSGQNKGFGGGLDVGYIF